MGVTVGSLRNVAAALILAAVLTFPGVPTATGHVVKVGGIPAPGRSVTPPPMTPPASALNDPNWRNLTSAVGPGPPAVAGAMVNDRSDGYVLWFGGTAPTGDRNETWTFAGGHWTNRTQVADAPPAPSLGVNLVYDASDGYVLLLTSTAAPQTWVYRAGVWHNWTLVVNGTPGDRVGAALGYDSADGRTVLFGGFAPGGTYLSDTMYFQAGDWVATSASGPGARAWATVSDDPADGGLLLTGGETEGHVYHDTWTLAGVTWTSRSTTGAPSLAPNGLAPAPGGSVVGFGGSGCAMAPLGPCNVTNAYSNGAWRAVAEPTAPTPRTGMVATYDSGDGLVLAFGGAVNGRGLGDTWAMGGPVGASVVGEAPRVDTDTDVSFSAGGSGGYGNFTYAFPNEPTGCFPAGPAAITCEIGVAGNYTIGVTATDSLGNHSSSTTVVTIVTLLSGTVGASTNVTDVGLPIVFTAAPFGGTGPYRYVWTGLPPGCPSADTASLTCVPSSPGFFAVAANLTDSYGTAIYTPAVSVVVHSPPIVFASADRLTGPDPLSVNFTSVVTGGTAPFAYRWDLGNGAIAATPNASTVYPGSGTYLVTVTVTDALGASASWTLDHLVTAYSPLNVSVSATAPTWTVGAVVSFSASVVGGLGGSRVGWTFGDGGAAGGPSAAHAYGAPGNFTVAVTVTDDAGEVATANLVIHILAPPAETGGPGILGGTGVTVTAALALGGVLGGLLVGIWTRRQRGRAELVPRS